MSNMTDVIPDYRVKNLLTGRSRLVPNNIKKGSSVKCVDTFHIALADEPEVCITQKESQDGLGCLFCYHPPMQKTFSCKHFETAGNRLKNHDIITDKTPADKGKNTHKRQARNQQEIS